MRFFSAFLGLILAATLLVGTGLFFVMKAVWDRYLPAGVRRRRFWRIMGGLSSACVLLGVCFLFWRDLIIWIAYSVALAGVLELLCRLARRLLKKRRPLNGMAERFVRVCGRVWRSRLLPFALAALCVLLGAVNLAHIRTTAYDLRPASASSLSALPDKQLTVYVLSDIHIGTIQNPETVFRYLDAIAAEKPDLLLLCGDLTDESSPEENARELFARLGKIPTTYGVYAVDGNHDRSYTKAQCEQNGIVFLEDACVETEAFRIVGRKDASGRNRLPVSGILTEEQKQTPKYTILLDHQPNSGTPEDWAGADLVLCGHTHGGQVFPANLVLEIAGYNAGLYAEQDRTVIVTSGVAGWGFKTKTCAPAEGVKIVIHAP